MASEYSSIARPYSEAAFSHAVEKGALDNWSDMLAFLAAVVSDATLSNMLGNPALDRAKTEKLILDIVDGKLNDEATNFVKLLVANKRLAVLPEISAQFEALKNAQAGAIDVMVTSAFEMDDAQISAVVNALKKKFNSEINISTETDESLIGGIKIRAGDQVIDGSIKGQLQKLANELGI